MLSLYDAQWYGSLGSSRPRAANGAAGVSAMAKAATWYANVAATGSTPSLYQDDLLEGPVSALLPEPLPPGIARTIISDAEVSPRRTAAAAPDPRQQFVAGSNFGNGRDDPAISGPMRPLLTAAPHWQHAPTSPQRDEQLPPQAPVPIRNGISGDPSTTGMGKNSSKEPALGTWAHRQYKLPLPGRLFQQRQRGQGLSPPQEWQEQPQSLSQQQQAFAASSVAQPIPGTRQATQPQLEAAAPAATQANGDGTNASDDEEEVIERAAWRWRFAKRWQAEQVRQLDPSASADGDGMEDVLAYLAATGGNPWEVSRTMSDGLGGSSGSAPHMLGNTLDSVGLLGQEQLLVGDMSRNASYAGSPSRRALASASGSGAAPSALRASVSGRGPSGSGAQSSGGRHGAATRELKAVKKRATQLLQAQTDIDKAANERWREAQAPAGGDLWVGPLLDAVEVDDWGKFKFVLVRLRDHTGRQKLFVRGSNYASEGKLLEALHRKLMGLAAAHDVPAEPLEMIGGGVMEWRRDRDRHLHLHSAFVSPHSGGPNGPMTAAEVLNLTGVLTKQSLPIHYKVTTDGSKAL